MTQNEAGSVVKVGVLGCGNVGAALVALVEARGSEIAARTGITLEVAKVAVRSLTRKRPVHLDESVLTRDAAGCALRVLSPGLVDGGTERVRIDLLGAESARARTESEQVIVSDDRGRVLRVNLVEGRVDRSLRVRL